MDEIKDFVGVYLYFQQNDALPDGVATMNDFKQQLRENPKLAKSTVGILREYAGVDFSEDEFAKMYVSTVKPVKKKESTNGVTSQVVTPKTTTPTTTSKQGTDSKSSAGSLPSSTPVDTPKVNPNLEFRENNGKMEIFDTSTGQFTGTPMQPILTQEQAKANAEKLTKIKTAEIERQKKDRLAAIANAEKLGKIGKNEAARQRKEATDLALKSSLAVMTDFEKAKGKEAQNPTGFSSYTTEPIKAKPYRDDKVDKFIQDFDFGKVVEDLNTMTGGKVMSDYSKYSKAMKEKYPYLPDSFFKQAGSQGKEVMDIFQRSEIAHNPFDKQNSPFAGVDIDIVDKYLDSRTDLNYKQKQELRPYVLSQIRTKQINNKIDKKVNEALLAEGIVPLPERAAKIKADYEKLSTKILVESESKFNAKKEELHSEFDVTIKSAKADALTKIQQEVARLNPMIQSGQISESDAKAVIDKMVAVEDANIRSIHNSYQARLKAQAIASKAEAEKRFAMVSKEVGDIDAEDIDEYKRKYLAYWQTFSSDLTQQEREEQDRRFHGLNYAQRWAQNISVGVLSSVEGATSFLSMLGVDGMASNADWLELATTAAPQPIMPDFTWAELGNGDWWTTKFAQALGSSAPMMIPAAGITAGTASMLAKTSLSAGVRAGISGATGAAFSRPLESAIEAGGVYRQALAEGESFEEAKRQGSYVYWRNMALYGLDAVQLAITFGIDPKKLATTKMGIMERPVNAVAKSKTATFGFSTVTEGGEEVYQGWIAERAKNPDLTFLEYAQSSKAKEEFVLGAAIGMGFSAPSLLKKTDSKIKEVNDMMILYLDDASKGKATPVERIKMREAEMVSTLSSLLENGLIQEKEYLEAIETLQTSSAVIEETLGLNIEGNQFKDIVHLATKARELKKEMDKAEDGLKEVKKAQYNETVKALNAVMSGKYEGTVRIGGVPMTLEQAGVIVGNSTFLENVTVEDIQGSVGSETVINQIYEETKNVGHVEKFFKDVAKKFGMTDKTSMEIATEVAQMEESELKTLGFDATALKSLADVLLQQNQTETTVPVEATETEVIEESENKPAEVEEVGEREQEAEVIEGDEDSVEQDVITESESQEVDEMGDIDIEEVIDTTLNQNIDYIQNNSQSLQDVSQTNPVDNEGKNADGFLIPSKRKEFVNTMQSVLKKFKNSFHIFNENYKTGVLKGIMKEELFDNIQILKEFIESESSITLPNGVNLKKFSKNSLSNIFKMLDVITKSGIEHMKGLNKEIFFLDIKPNGVKNYIVNITDKNGKSSIELNITKDGVFYNGNKTPSINTELYLAAMMERYFSSNIIDGIKIGSTKLMKIKTLEDLTPMFEQYGNNLQKIIFQIAKVLGDINVGFSISEGSYFRSSYSTKELGEGESIDIPTSSININVRDAILNESISENLGESVAAIAIHEITHFLTLEIRKHISKVDFKKINHVMIKMQTALKKSLGDKLVLRKIKELQEKYPEYNLINRINYMGSSSSEIPTVFLEHPAIIELFEAIDYEYTGVQRVTLFDKLKEIIADFIQPLFNKDLKDKNLATAVTDFVIDSVFILAEKQGTNGEFIIKSAKDAVDYHNRRLREDLERTKRAEQEGQSTNSPQEPSEIVDTDGDLEPVPTGLDSTKVTYEENEKPTEPEKTQPPQVTPEKKILNILGHQTTVEDLLKYLERSENADPVIQYVIELLRTSGLLDFITLQNGETSNMEVAIEKGRLKFTVSISEKDVKSILDEHNGDIEAATNAIIGHELVHIATAIPSLIKRGFITTADQAVIDATNTFYAEMENIFNDFKKVLNSLQGGILLKQFGIGAKQKKGFRLKWNRPEFTVDEFMSEVFSNSNLWTMVSVATTEKVEGGYAIENTLYEANKYSFNGKSGEGLIKDTFFNRIKTAFMGWFVDAIQFSTENESRIGYPKAIYQSLDIIAKVVGVSPEGELLLNDKFEVVKPITNDITDQMDKAYYSINEQSSIEAIEDVIQDFIGSPEMAQQVGRTFDVAAIQEDVEAMVEKGDRQGLMDILDNIYNNFTQNNIRLNDTRSLTEIEIEDLVREKEFVEEELDDDSFKAGLTNRYQAKIAMKKFKIAAKALIGKVPNINSNKKSFEYFTDEDVAKARFMYSGDAEFKIDQNDPVYIQARDMAIHALTAGMWNFKSFANFAAVRGLNLLNTSEHSKFHAAFQRAKREYRKSTRSMQDFEYHLSRMDNFMLHAMDSKQLLKKVEEFLKQNNLIENNINEIGSAYEAAELQVSRIASQVEDLMEWFRGRTAGLNRNSAQSFTTRLFEALEVSAAAQDKKIDSEKLIESFNQFLFLKHYEERNVRGIQISTDLRNRKLAYHEARRDSAKGQEAKLRHQEIINDILAGKSYPIIETASGMTRENAQKIEDDLIEAGYDLAVMEQFAIEFKDKVIKGRLDLLKDNDILTDEEYQTLATGSRNGKWLDNDGREKDYDKFDFYVPLYVEAEALISGDKSIRMYNEEGSDMTYLRPKNQDGRPISKGITPTEAYFYETRMNITQNALSEFNTTVAFIEKQKMRRRLAKFAETTGDKNFWRVVEGGTEVTLSDDGSVTGYKNKISEGVRRNSLAFVEGGKTKYLLFIPSLDMNGKEVMNPILASLNGSIRNYGVGSLTENGFYEVAVKISAKYNAWKRALITQYNPIFPATNFPRDLFSSFLDARTIAEKYGVSLIKLRAKMIANIPKAIGSLLIRPTSISMRFNNKRDAFFANGGAVSWLRFDGDQSAINVITDETQTSLEKNIGRKKRSVMNMTVNPFLETIAHLNDSVENTMRLSLFAAVEDLLIEKKKAENGGIITANERRLIAENAAHSAKDLMNFERKGASVGGINDWFLFFNAGMQGTERSLRRFKTRSKDYAAVVMLGFLLAGWNDMMEDDDEDEVLAQTIHSTYIGKSKIAIAVGDMYATIPKPYAISKGFFNLGESLYKALYKDGSYMAAISGLFGDVMDSVDFVGGGSPNKASAYIPTILKPLFEIATDKNWTGIPITNKAMTGNKKRMEQIGLEPSSLATGIAESLDNATNFAGGSEGILAVSPSIVQYLFDDLFPGIGKEILRGTESGVKAWKGEPVEKKNIPLVRSFVFDPKENPKMLLALLNDAAERKDWRGLSKGEIDNIIASWNYLYDNTDISATYLNSIRTKLENKYEMYPDFEF